MSAHSIESIIALINNPTVKHLDLPSVDTLSSTVEIKALNKNMQLHLFSEEKLQLAIGEAEREHQQSNAEKSQKIPELKAEIDNTTQRKTELVTQLADLTKQHKRHQQVANISYNLDITIIKNNASLATKILARQIHENHASADSFTNGQYLDSSEQAEAKSALAALIVKADKNEAQMEALFSRFNPHGLASIVEVVIDEAISSIPDPINNPKVLSHEQQINEMQAQIGSLSKTIKEMSAEMQALEADIAEDFTLPESAFTPYSAHKLSFLRSIGYRFSDTERQTVIERLNRGPLSEEIRDELVALLILEHQDLDTLLTEHQNILLPISNTLRPILLMLVTNSAHSSLVHHRDFVTELVDTTPLSMYQPLLLLLLQCNINASIMTGDAQEAYESIEKDIIKHLTGTDSDALPDIIIELLKRYPDFGALIQQIGDKILERISQQAVFDAVIQAWSTAESTPTQEEGEFLKQVISKAGPGSGLEVTPEQMLPFLSKVNEHLSKSAEASGRKNTKFEPFIAIQQQVMHSLIPFNSTKELNWFIMLVQSAKELKMIISILNSAYSLLSKDVARPEALYALQDAFISLGGDIRDKQAAKLLLTFVEIRYDARGSLSYERISPLLTLLNDITPKYISDKPLETLKYWLLKSTLDGMAPPSMILTTVDDYAQKVRHQCELAYAEAYYALYENAYYASTKPADLSASYILYYETIRSCIRGAREIARFSQEYREALRDFWKEMKTGINKKFSSYLKKSHPQLHAITLLELNALIEGLEDSLKTRVNPFAKEATIPYEKISVDTPAALTSFISDPHISQEAKKSALSKCFPNGFKTNKKYTAFFATLGPDLVKPHPSYPTYPQSRDEFFELCIQIMKDPEWPFPASEQQDLMTFVKGRFTEQGEDGGAAPPPRSATPIADVTKAASTTVSQVGADRERTMQERHDEMFKL